MKKKLKMESAGRRLFALGMSLLMACSAGAPAAAKDAETEEDGAVYDLSCAPYDRWLLDEDAAAALKARYKENGGGDVSVEPCKIVFSQAAYSLHGDGEDAEQSVLEPTLKNAAAGDTVRVVLSWTVPDDDAQFTLKSTDTVLYTLPAEIDWVSRSGRMTGGGREIGQYRIGKEEDGRTTIRVRFDEDFVNGDGLLYNADRYFSVKFFGKISKSAAERTEETRYVFPGFGTIVQEGAAESGRLEVWEYTLTEGWKKPYVKNSRDGLKLETDENGVQSIWYLAEVCAASGDHGALRIEARPGPYQYFTENAGEWFLLYEDTYDAENGKNAADFGTVQILDGGGSFVYQLREDYVLAQGRTIYLAYPVCLELSWDVSEASERTLTGTVSASSDRQPNGVKDTNTIRSGKVWVEKNGVPDQEADQIAWTVYFGLGDTGLCSMEGVRLSDSLPDGIAPEDVSAFELAVLSGTNVRKDSAGWTAADAGETEAVKADFFGAGYTVERPERAHCAFRITYTTNVAPGERERFVNVARIEKDGKQGSAVCELPWQSGLSATLQKGAVMADGSYFQTVGAERINLREYRPQGTNILWFLRIETPKERSGETTLTVKDTFQRETAEGETLEESERMTFLPDSVRVLQTAYDRLWEDDAEAVREGAFEIGAADADGFGLHLHYGGDGLDYRLATYVLYETAPENPNTADGTTKIYRNTARLFDSRAAQLAFDCAEIGSRQRLLNKLHSFDGTDAAYRIEVNESRLQLLPGQDRIVLTDCLGAALRLKEDTVTFQINGLAEGSDAYERAAALCESRYDEAARTLELTVPDGVHVTVQYEARIEPAEGELPEYTTDGNGKNTVWLDARAATVVYDPLTETEVNAFAQGGWLRLAARTRVTVEKVWNDEENRDGSRPGEAKMLLLRTIGARTDAPEAVVSENGEIACAVLNAENHWTHTWEGLYAATPDGERIDYFVAEDTESEEMRRYLSEAPAYSAPEALLDKTGRVVGRKITVTNTHTPAKENAGEKQGGDEGGEDGDGNGEKQDGGEGSSGNQGEGNGGSGGNQGEGGDGSGGNQGEDSGGNDGKPNGGGGGTDSGKRDGGGAGGQNDGRRGGEGKKSDTSAYDEGTDAGLRTPLPANVPEAPALLGAVRGDAESSPEGGFLSVDALSDAGRDAAAGTARNAATGDRDTRRQTALLIAALAGLTVLLFTGDGIRKRRRSRDEYGGFS